MAITDTSNRYIASTPTEQVNVFPRVISTSLRRISWGAILAGTAISLVAMLALNMLGLSLGAATINPVSELDPIEPALGTGAMIWFAVSNLIALFLGGMVAGRMSGSTDDADGITHGVVTWAVTTLISLWILTTSVGNVIGGLTNAASQSLGAAGQAVAEVSPEVAEALDSQNLTLQGIQNEVRTFMQNSTVAGAQPPAGTETDTSSTSTDTTMTLNEIELNRSIRNFLNLDAAQDADRDNLAAMLAERTGMTQAEARETVTRWEQTYVQLRQEAEDVTRRVSQQVADAVTVFAGAVFAAMLVGMFAGGAGGYVGTEVLAKREEEAAVTTPRP